MYDKYQTGNTFPIGGSRLPKHKGFLIHNASTVPSATGFTAYILNDQGNTFAMNFGLDVGPNYFSNGFFAINAMSTGVTGILMN